MRVGIHVYCPIASSHPLAVAGLKWTGPEWIEYDKLFMRESDGLIVLMLDGWKTSEGVQEEIRLFREWGKPISYLKGVE